MIDLSENKYYDDESEREKCLSLIAEAKRYEVLDEVIFTALCIACRLSKPSKVLQEALENCDV